MCITGFLSLWISNVATVSMILPVIEAVVQQLVMYDPALCEQNDLDIIVGSSMTGWFVCTKPLYLIFVLLN
jgi:hypothetical protein